MCGLYGFLFKTQALERYLKETERQGSQGASDI